MAFDRLDSDDSGYISRKNLRDLLGEDCSKDDVERLMEWGDLDGDGKITYKEFLTAFRTKTDKVAHQLAHMESSMPSEVENELVGLDATIPGGRYDPDLSPELKAQAERINL